MKKIIFICLLLFAITSFSNAQFTLTDSLKAYYPFNSNANDESGNGYDGTVNGATLVEDRFGNSSSAYSFDGADDFIDLGDILDNTFANDLFSISAWFYSEDVTQGGLVISKRDGTGVNSDDMFGIWVSSGIIFEVTNDNDIDTTIQYPMDNAFNNKWYHISALYNRTNTKMQLYLNGLLVAENTNCDIDIVDEPNVHLAIGAEYGSQNPGTKANFSGMIDDIRIYNRALEENEILQLYQEGINEFITKSYNLDDNQVPPGWEFTVMTPDADISNGRMNAFITDAKGQLSRSGYMPVNTDSVVINWDGNIATSSWGMGTRLFIDANDEFSYYFRHTVHTVNEGSNSLLTMIIFSADTVFNYIMDHVHYPLEQIDFHYTVILTDTLLRYIANRNTDGSEFFNVSYNPAQYGAIYILDSISDIRFQVYTTTDNNAWLDNPSIKIVEKEKNSGLVAWYPFNGNANDESGNGNHGTVSGATLINDRFEKANNAYSFDGTDDFIDIGDVLDNTFTNDLFSISTWFFTEDVTHPGILISKRDGTGVNSDDMFGMWVSEYAMFEVSDDNDNDSTIKYLLDTIHNDRWNHVVAVYERINTRMQLFLNGSLVRENDSCDIDIVDEPNVHLAIGAEYGSQNPGTKGNFLGTIDDIRIYNRVLTGEEIQILYSGYSVDVHSVSDAKVGRIIEIPVSTDELSLSSNIISYQFDMEYDETILEYLGASLSGTIAAGGIIDVNNSDPGELAIGYITVSPLTDSGDIVKLQFKIIDDGNSELNISDFYYNAMEVFNINNGNVIAWYYYGDIDENNMIQAYDAALVLQYSAGLDPLPVSDPIPWESWRETVADVDAEQGITANDASQILKASIGLIDTFPVESSTKGLLADETSIILMEENDHILFFADGDLYGLNLFTDNFTEVGLGQPVILDDNILLAININQTDYAIALCTAYAPEEGTPFMKIPFTTRDSICFDLIINTKHSTAAINLVTGIPGITDTEFRIYPNPVTNRLNITGMTNQVSNPVISIYNMNGQILKQISLKSLEIQVDVSDLKEGIYVLEIRTETFRKSRRFVKK